MARSDAFFAEFGCRPDVSTIFVRFFDENSIDFVERLLDDRRSLDGTLKFHRAGKDARCRKNLEKLRQGAQNQGSATFRRSTVETAWRK